MKTIPGLLAIFICSSLQISLQAQPVNDNPCGAIDLTVVQTSDPCTPTVYTMVNPTYVNLSLPDPGGCPGPATLPAYPDYWFRFTAINTSALLNFIAEQGTTTGGGTFFTGANYFVIYKAGNCNGPFTLTQGCGRSDILYTKQLNNLEINGVYYIRVVSALSNVATSNLGICVSTNMPASTSRVGINVNQPKANLDVAGNVLFRNDVNFQGRITYYGANDFTQSGLPDSVYGKSSILRFSDVPGKKIILGHGGYFDQSYPGSTYGEAGLGVGSGTLQLQYPSLNGGGISFGYGNAVSAFTQTALLSGAGNLQANGSGNFGNGLTVTGNGSFSGSLGIGLTGPSAKLSIANGAAQLAGAAMSGTFKTSAGSLGGNTGDELTLASIGFLSNNNSALGIRAYRNAAGNSWVSTSLLIGYDVDNTPRAAGGTSISLNAAGNVGIGTANAGRRLDVVAGPSGDPTVLAIGNRGGFGPAAIEFVSDYGLGSQWRPGYIASNDYGGFTGRLEFFTNGTGSGNLYGAVKGFEVRNGVAFTASGTVGNYSDERLKKNITAFTDGLNVIEQINPVQFQYNEQSPFRTETSQVGIVAQELEKAAPYMVHTGPEAGYTDLRWVDNQAYTFLLINAVKELQKQLEAQQKEIAELKHQLQKRK